MDNMALHLETEIAQRLQSVEEWSEKPFGHVLVRSFLDRELARELLASTTAVEVHSTFKYSNALEVKETHNNWNQFEPLVYSYFQALGMSHVVKEIERITRNTPLLPDTGLHGGGIHLIRSGGKLNVHQDYAVHPKTGLQRQVNAILYLSPDWQSDWGGQLELWEGDTDKPTAKIVTIEPEFNSLIIFDTSPGSWHGFPEPLRSPAGVTRYSLAYYYCKPSDSNTPRRHRARYAPSESQRGDKKIIELIEKRASLTDAGNVYRTEK